MEIPHIYLKIQLEYEKITDGFYLYAHIHGERGCYRDFTSGAVMHIDDTGMPLGDNLGKTDSCGAEYDFSFVHMGGLRPFGRPYFEDDALTGYGGGEEYKLNPSTATPALAQFLVFEVYEDRVVFYIRNTGNVEHYTKEDELKEYTVYFV